MVASLIAIITFLIVLNVQRSMLIPGGIPRHEHLAAILYSKRAYQCHRSNPLSPPIVGSCISQIFKYRSQDSCCGLYVVHSRPLVPGYISYRTTSFFVSGQYRQAVTSVTLVVILALVISIGMASEPVVLKLYHSYQRYQKEKCS